jgi:type I protein arginine methyltransferase
LPETYTIHGHGAMISDRVRTDAYAAALAAVIRPESVVLDIGTGTGMFALLACRLGARRVYAIEPGDAIHLAADAARAAGFADRIHFIQGMSTETTLPERADVMVSDLRGVVPLFEHHLPSVIDARARLLTDDAVLIPRRDVIRAAPAEAADEHARIVSPWDEHDRGFDLSGARRSAVNGWIRARLPPGALLAPAETWAALDYRTVADPNVTGTMEWTVARDGTAHGLSLWFDTELAEGIGYTTGPEGPRTIYGTGFLPWPDAVELAAGDRVAVELRARLMGGDYVWAWNTRITPVDGDPTEFRQSTFLSQPLSAAALRRRAHDHRPVLGEQGRIDRTILEMMDGAATLEEIAREVRRRFPGRFATWEHALSRVGRLSETFAE